MTSHRKCPGEFEKTEDESFDNLEIDWSDDLNTGDTITSASVASISPVGLTVTNVAVNGDNDGITFDISGGSNDTDYEVKFNVDTVGGDTDLEATLLVVVRA